MSRPSPAVLFWFLVAVLALFGGITAVKGAVFVAKHEGDTLHLLDIVTRMAAGERIHQDFMTPIGVLAFAPVVALVRAGFGPGQALIWAQIAVAALLLPAVWWTVRSRLTGIFAWVAALYMMVLALALTYGEADASISMSMHYNRWAWVLAYVAVLLSLLPPLGRERQALDGALIGLAMAALVLIKVTYFVALAPPVALALILRRAWRAIGAAAVAGLAVALVATLWGGLDFWRGYVADLAAVSASPMRPQPGFPLGNLLGAPAFLGINLVLLLAVVLLRQAREAQAGLVLLLLAPGLVYITFQNFGNDPQWLILLVAVLSRLRPAPELRNGWGWNLARTTDMAAAAAFAFALPSFLNLTYSPWRHYALERTEYTPLVAHPGYDDILTWTLRASRVDGQVALDEPGGGLDHMREAAKRTDIATLNGVELAHCEVMSGLTAWYSDMADDIAAAGHAGKRVFEADLFNVLYLYGDFQRLKGAAPWYYGGAPGIDDADLVLVPECPVGPGARKLKLAAVEAAGIGLAEVRRTPLYVLYAPVRP